MTTKMRKIQPKIYTKNGDQYIKYGKLDVIAQYGLNDYAYFWKVGNEVWIVSINYRIYYVGLEVFHSNESVGDVFIQNQSDVDYTFPKGLDDYSMPYIAKVLREYIF